MTRRVLVVQLQSETDASQNRTGFRHANIKQWAKDNRPTILAKVLTVWTAWFTAGPPVPETVQTKPLGSFEAWSESVRAALLWADQNLEDPVESQTHLQNQDRTGNHAMLHTMVSLWHTLDPLGCGLLLKDVNRALRDYSMDAEEVATFTQLDNTWRVGQPITQKLAKGFYRRVVNKPVSDTTDGSVGMIVEVNEQQHKQNKHKGSKRYIVKANTIASALAHTTGTSPKKKI